MGEPFRELGFPCWLWIMVIALPGIQARVRTNLSRLHTDLLDGYVQVRPAVDWARPLDVDVSFTLYQIRDLDGRDEVLFSMGQISMNWIDPNLAWNASEYGDIWVIEMSSEEIWQPTIGLKNSAGTVLPQTWRETIPSLVRSNGAVTYAPAGSFETTCKLYMWLFPFDVQECCLEWGSLVAPMAAVLINTSSIEIETTFYVPGKEFDLDKTWTETMNRVKEAGNQASVTLSSVRFWLRLKRNPAFYLLNIIVPTVVLALLSVCTFLVPVDAGEKVSLAITVLLSFSVFTLLLADYTPQSSDSTPLLAIYLTTVMCLSALSLVFTMISLNIYHRSPVRRMPSWLRYFIIELLGKVFLPSRNNKVAPDDGQCFQTLDDTDDGDMHPSDTDADGSAATAMEQLLYEVRKLTCKLAQDANEDDLKDEWILAATVADRFFFILLLIVQLMMIIVIYGIMPSTDLA